MFLYFACIALGVSIQYIYSIIKSREKQLYLPFGDTDQLHP